MKSVSSLWLKKSNIDGTPREKQTNKQTNQKGREQPYLSQGTELKKLWNSFKQGKQRLLLSYRQASS